jgi:hypothetical protein
VDRRLKLISALRFWATLERPPNPYESRRQGIGPGTNTWPTVTSPEIIRQLGVRPGTISGVLDTLPERQRQDYMKETFSTSFISCGSQRIR